MTKQLTLGNEKKIEHLFRIITYTFCMHTENQILDMSV